MAHLKEKTTKTTTKYIRTKLEPDDVETRFVDAHDTPQTLDGRFYEYIYINKTIVNVFTKFSAYSDY